MASLEGSHVGNVKPEMESTLVNRTTDSLSVGPHYTDLGSSAAQQSPTSDELAEEMFREILELSDYEQDEIRQAFNKPDNRPVLLTEDDELIPDDALCLKRQRALKRRMGPRSETNKVVKIYRHLQRKLVPKPYAEDPSPYQPYHIFYVLNTN